MFHCLDVLQFLPPYLICVIFFGEVSVQILLPVFNFFLIVSFQEFLYVLDTSPLSDMYFANMCTKEFVCLFTSRISHRPEMLDFFSEVQLADFHSSVALLLYFKSHHHGQGHLCYLLCHLPGFLWFC